MLQFGPGLAPVDCLVDVLGGSSVGPGLVFDWFLIGVSLSVMFVVVPEGAGGVEGVGDVDGGGGGEGGVTDDWGQVDRLVDLSLGRNADTEGLSVVVTEVLAAHEAVFPRPGLGLAGPVRIVLLVQHGDLAVHLHLRLVGQREVLEVQAGGELPLDLVSQAGGVGVMAVAGRVFI